MTYLETRNIESTLIRISRCQPSIDSSTTEPWLPMPTLLSKRSMPPNALVAALTISSHSLSIVTSAANAIASPPSDWINSAVRSANSGLRSTHTTRQPERASVIAAARPLPIPSPRAPAPVTSATLSLSPIPNSKSIFPPTLEKRISRTIRKC